jgi:iron complex outermembrane receptor protein
MKANNPLAWRVRHAHRDPRRRPKAAALAAVMAAAFGSLGACLPSQAAMLAAADLAELSLEQLSNIVVTSVSRQEEKLSEAPASVYVISSADIRRSGATSIPEALRLAPNLNVMRADANQYAISARGFNNVLANKMLVMIDGRTVYTPLFSGVFWEAQDIVLDDVERIEVISGPGATLWGANAVNGVINIISKAASATAGTLAGLAAGTREAGARLRHGGKLEGGGSYRVYGKYFDRDNSVLGRGTAVRDASQRGQMGFRADWEDLTLQGDAYDGDIDQIPSARKISGANLLARWTRALAGGSTLLVQTYYDRTERFHPGTFRETLDTLDMEFQHGLAAAGAHRWQWGGGYRHSRDRIENFPANAFLPPNRSLQWANLFAQDEIDLRQDIKLTLGAKIERNPYTGAEFLPSARLAWQLSDARLAWGALSRAVRAPSRIDREFFLPGAPPYTLAGGPGFQSEISNVAELGYRAQPTPALSYSFTLFHHAHDDLRSAEPSPVGLMWENRIEGRTTGLEGWGSYQAARNWRLSGGLVTMRHRLRPKADSRDAGGLATLGNDPSHWWSLRSAWDISEQWDLDLTLRHVGSLYGPRVPSYNAVDARLAWQANRKLEIALIVQNMFDPRHPEWGTAGVRAQQERSTLITLVWRD